MQRAVLQISLLVFGMVYMRTESTLVLVLPVWLITLLASSRSNKEDFDVVDMFWLLNTLSFVVAPLVTIYEPEGSQIFSTGAIVPLNFGHSLTYRQDQIFELYFLIFMVTVINAVVLPKHATPKSTRDFSIRYTTLSLIVIFIVAVLVEIAMRGGIANTLAARREKVDAAGGIFLIFSRSFTLACSMFLAAKLTEERSWLRWVGYIVLFSLLLVLYNPFNSARFVLLQGLLPPLLITFTRILSFRFFCISVIAGSMVVMPILSATTRAGTDADLASVEISPEFFLGYLDQHKVLLHLIDMVERNGLEWGSSTLSVLLFFVPRAIWPDKPLVLGLEVGNELYGYGFVGTANLSGPIFGDFYYDFGIPGVLLGSVALAIIVRQLLARSATISGVPVFGYFAIAALPILFRGTVGAVIPSAFFTFLFLIGLIVVQEKLSRSARNLSL